MKFERVPITFLIFVYVQDCSSVNQCYVCSTPHCEDLSTEKCPQNRKKSCIAYFAFENKTQVKGCSNRKKCPEGMANTTDCYVCDKDLCNRKAPDATLCYKCVNEACSEAGHITTERCLSGEANEITAPGFFCYTMIMIVNLDIFGALNHHSAGCITKTNMHILQSRCHDNIGQMCVICNHSLCNDNFQTGIDASTIMYSTYTVEDVENISFGVPEEPLTSSVKSYEATCVILVLVLIIMVSILPKEC